MSSGSSPVAALPPPVARYLELAQVTGKRTPRSVHSKQSGVMRLRPDKGWLDFKAEQSHSLDPPGFTWRGTIKLNRFFSIAAVDRFVDGRGSLEVSAWGRIPLNNLYGPEMDSAELLRFLIEVVWFPTFWVSPLITWRPVDDRSSIATIRVNDVEASARIIFDEGGLPHETEARRYRTVGKRFELTPWRGRCDDFREANGVVIPHKFAVSWELPEGTFEWLRASIDQIEYSYP